MFSPELLRRKDRSLQRHFFLVKAAIARPLVLVKRVRLHYNGVASSERPSGRGSARLERTVRVREVGGSNPPAPTFENLWHHGCSFWATVMHLVAGGTILTPTTVRTVFQSILLFSHQENLVLVYLIYLALIRPGEIELKGARMKKQDLFF
jgi:hypothetical protein